jgi:hypothetical protein
MLNAGYAKHWGMTVRLYKDEEPILPNRKIDKSKAKYKAIWELWELFNYPVPSRSSGEHQA